jgi:hypothetical protein
MRGNGDVRAPLSFVDALSNRSVESTDRRPGISSVPMPGRAIQAYLRARLRAQDAA